MPRTFLRKNILRASALLACATVLGAAVYAAAGAGQKPAAAPAYPPTQVALAAVQRSEVQRLLSGIGELEAARQVQVATEAAGRVTHIAFASGQAVQAGQLLVQLNDAPEQAERLRLQAQLLQAETAHERTRKLVADNAATQEQLDNALAERDMARGALRHTDALIAQKAIRAPFAGVLGIRRVQLGQYLAPADAVASLVDARTLQANFSLDEQSSPALQVGQAVQVLVDAHADRVFAARVNAVDPLIGKSRTVQVQATLANPQGLLKAGMYASIRVARPGMASTLTVPETAVTYTAYGETVFVATPDAQQALTVRRVAVQVGERQGGRVEVVTGLREGDQVVTSGQNRLSDGMAVQAVREDTLATKL